LQARQLHRWCGLRLCDIGSALPYRAQMGGEHRINLAMRMGDTNHAKSIGTAQWQAFAKQAGRSWASVRGHVVSVADGLMSGAGAVVEQALNAYKLDSTFAGDFAKQIQRRAAHCSRQLSTSRS
jgi:hypothetical protein